MEEKGRPNLKLGTNIAIVVVLKPSTGILDERILCHPEQTKYLKIRDKYCNGSGSKTKCGPFEMSMYRKIKQANY